MLQLGAVEHHCKKQQVVAEWTNTMVMLSQLKINQMTKLTKIKHSAMQCHHFVGITARLNHRMLFQKDKGTTYFTPNRRHLVVLAKRVPIINKAVPRRQYGVHSKMGSSEKKVTPYLNCQYRSISFLPTKTHGHTVLPLDVRKVHVHVRAVHSRVIFTSMASSFSSIQSKLKMFGRRSAMLSGATIAHLVRIKNHHTSNLSKMTVTREMKDSNQRPYKVLCMDTIVNRMLLSRGHLAAIIVFIEKVETTAITGHHLHLERTVNGLSLIHI